MVEGEREKKGGTRERKREGEKEECTNLRVVQSMMENQREKPKLKQHCYVLQSLKWSTKRCGQTTGWSHIGLPTGPTSDGFRFFTFPQLFSFFICSVEIISPWENIREEYDIGNPCHLSQQGEAGISSHQPKRLQTLGKDPRGLAFYTLA